MSSTLLLGSILAASVSTPACVAHPPVLVGVLMDVSAVAVRTDFSLAQIEAMRKRTSGTDRHPTLGFYGHRFGYTVEVEPMHADNSPCVSSVQVRVHIVLSERVIEIGKDLATNPCLYSVAEAHYRRHADADDRAASQYSQTIALVLRTSQLLPDQDDYAFDKVEPRQIEQLVRTAIDATLVPYDATRVAAQISVDTKTEAVKMATSCSAPPPRAGHT
jgi:hypothetical protein